MALALALSVIATTGTGIVLTARIIYGMASYRVLPEFLSNVSRRFATPVAASIIVGLLLIGLTCGVPADHLGAERVQRRDRGDRPAVRDLLHPDRAGDHDFYYRRRVFTSVWDSVILGILPLGAAGFLGWIVVKSLAAPPRRRSGRWSASSSLGVVLMLAARFILRSPFFQIRRESEAAGARARAAG